MKRHADGAQNVFCDMVDDHVELSRSRQFKVAVSEQVRVRGPRGIKLNRPIHRLQPMVSAHVCRVISADIDRADAESAVETICVFWMDTVVTRFK